MAKASKKPVEVAVAADSEPVQPASEIGGEVVKPETEAPQNEIILDAAAHKFTSIVNGDTALFQGVGVKRIIIQLRGE